MPQITTPLAQVLNPARQQGTQTGFLAPAAQAGQTRLSTIQNRQIQAKQEERQSAQAQFELMDAKQQQRFKSVALASAELLPSLEKGDFVTTNKLLDIRIQDLDRQNISSEDSREFKALLASDPDLAISQARNAIQTAKMAGAIETPEGAQVPFQLGTSRTVKKGGKLTGLTEVFNRETGKINLVETPLEGQIVSRDLGETAEDKRKRVVLTKFQEKSAAFAQKASAEAFAQLQPIREVIALYGEGIDLLDKGADTGAIASRLPSLKDLAVELDNVQSRLGLNVIQRTTFGSLSEAELKFALSSALPQNLSEPALRDWLVRKRAAQEKLLGYITDAAIYMGQEGNSVAGWMQLQRENQIQRDALKPKQKPDQKRTLETLTDQELLGLSLEELKQLKAQQGNP